MQVISLSQNVNWMLLCNSVGELGIDGVGSCVFQDVKDTDAGHGSSFTPAVKVVGNTKPCSSGQNILISFLAERGSEFLKMRGDITIIKF